MKDDLARDKAIQKAVAGQLQAQLESRAPNCPDAEALAAYVERTLTPGERRGCETHLATCSRCQEEVAELVRLAEAEQPVEVRFAVPARGAKVIGFRWAWAAPALLALVVAGLWYTVEFHQRLLRSRDTSEKVYSPVPPPAATRGAPAETQEAAAAPRPPFHIGMTQPARVLGKASKQAARLSEAASAPKPTAKAPQNEEAGLPQASVSGELGKIATPSERAHMAARASAPAPALESNLKAREDRLAARPEVPASPVADRVQASREGVAVEKSGIPAEEHKEAAPASSNAAVRRMAAPRGIGVQRAKPENWRVGPRGLIQKNDGRGNWVAQVSGVDADLLDITFPAHSVGWAVGRAGTILRTTDAGTRWIKIQSPTSDDLVQVFARDQQVAAVVTSNGQAFSTNNGGKSWSAASQR